MTGTIVAPLTRACEIAGDEWPTDAQYLVCSCEDTMPLDEAALRRACRGADVTTARQLCRAELERFRAAAAGRRAADRRMHAGSAAVREVAPEAADVAFVNVRETAGWSSEAGKAGPKMAALLAAAPEPRAGDSVRQPHQRRRGSGLRPRRARDRSRQSAQGPSRRHRADHGAQRTCRRRASPSFRW